VRKVMTWRGAASPQRPCCSSAVRMASRMHSCDLSLRSSKSEGGMRERALMSSR
jgi:hypothetical protein